MATFTGEETIIDVITSNHASSTFGSPDTFFSYTVPTGTYAKIVVCADLNEPSSASGIESNSVKSAIGCITFGNIHIYDEGETLTLIHEALYNGPQAAPSIANVRVEIRLFNHP